MLKESFFAGASAEQIVADRSAFIDDMLRSLWAEHGLGASSHALVAVGGYGRGHLHPASDIDLAIVLARLPTPEEREALELFITKLWDTGLQIGHSVRTVDDSVDAASDLTVATNLMEARLLTGSETVFDELMERTSAPALWPSPEFFSAKMAEQEARHGADQDDYQRLEPDIKTCPGGLRDIQTISWVANRHFGTSSLHGLVDEGFLTEAEFLTLHAGQMFLWRLRCALHFLAGRCDDRLGFDNQKAVAELFGHTDDGTNRGVESFMRGYYRTVRELSRLNELLLNLFREAILETDSERKPTVLNRRFQVRNNAIEVRFKGVFRRHPTALLEMFLLMQKNSEIKHVRAETLRLVRENLYLIDSEFRADIKARALFMEIMRQAQHIGRELQRMHRWGVLERYLPPFERVSGLMQFDLFHVYTVDEHCLGVVRQMRRFLYPLTLEDQTPLIREVIERVPKLELLFLSGLFHDIGKGRGGDHSELGADEATEFCLRHELSVFDTKLVSWLVRHHLVMSMTAQSRDVADPEVVADFAALVGDQMHLDYLYLLTVADIRGTNRELWTSWKDRLLASLYWSTRRALRRGLENPLDKEDRIEEVKTAAMRQLVATGFDAAPVQAFWESFDADYFLRHQPEEIAWHAETILPIGTAPDTPIVALRCFNDIGGTEIFIYTRDRDDLFATTTLLLDRVGLTVQDARILTLENGYTLDSYVVLDAESSAPIIAEHEQHRIARQIGDALDGGPLPVRRRDGLVERKKRHFKVPVTVEFSDAPEGGRTMMTVTAADQPGLLSAIGQAMQRAEVRLQNARIATFGERVEDVFYITDRSDRPVTDPAQLGTLSEAIVEALSR